MTTLTLNIPEAHKAEYQRLFTTMAKEYSLDDIEDFMLGLHMNRNDHQNYPISELRSKYAS